MTPRNKEKKKTEQINVFFIFSSLSLSASRFLKYSPQDIIIHPKLRNNPFLISQKFC